jgi:uncharacterized protein (DUF1015 family)
MAIENYDKSSLLNKLKQEFEITEFNFGDDASKSHAKQQMLSGMKKEFENTRAAFGIYSAGGSFYLAVLKNTAAMDNAEKNKSDAWKSLDVAVLHKLILEKHLGLDEKRLAAGKNVKYIKDTITAIDDLIAEVDNGKKQAAFFMNPPKLEQINAVADQDERMPQKATYFYPKLYTGFTVNKF